MDDSHFNIIDAKLDKIQEKLATNMARISVTEDQLKNIRWQLNVFYVSLLSILAFLVKKVFNFD